jgi:transposase
MSSTTANRVPSLDEAATFSPQQVVDLACSMSREIEVLKHQLDWFRRQIFGQKSERRIIDGGAGQLSLGEAINAAQSTCALPPVEHRVAAHTRRVATNKPNAGDDSVPFFDDTRVPVEVIELTAPEAEGLAPDDFEVIGHEESFRLAQRPGSYTGAHK